VGDEPRGLRTDRVPDGFHLEEGGHAVNALATLPCERVRPILLAMGATRNAGNMFRGTTLRVGEQFVRAAPQINAINVCVPRQVRHQLRASASKDVDHTGRYVTHGERLRKRYGWEWSPLARKQDCNVAASQHTSKSRDETKEW
jgi:hypothetical protein